ncbi:mitotic checkpoint regulator, MAD2B-interacting-domain-containing protein [Ampelomyces quisqualis]|uniref:Mitotic checkpoint regulator, MAD2B-interacting-domain-containing protein n=1 Tax=Ampelomyces quisqualis TaxID=50730 RepID=A0A6A5QSF2_AMPQU|nr:mitotic checkpoint regulator, MAD2B-interacting-domain-containing protein [Ampelomyces quisqualis]
MNLLAYSDSESDGEAPPAPKQALKQAPKPSFQKVVDRANPGRIKVNLPGASQPQAREDGDGDDAPPSKKPRLGGGAAFGGFNAMLPAPKKPAAATTSVAPPGKKALGKGLAAGKQEEATSESTDSASVPMSIPPPKAPAPRFVPMSVGKGKKKKPVVPRQAYIASGDSDKAASSTSNVHSLETSAPPPRKPKVSLFGVSPETAAPANPASNEAYTPMLYGARQDADAPVPDDVFETQPAYQPAQQVHTQPEAATSNGLTVIASELNLSEAERRQLFGKRGREADFSSAKIVEFNTDTEYAHNEKLRQQGEQVQHNALKSISGTGKNSLRSLINVASTQKDALEEHFASGYRNKKEAGNKYGW